jgi:hypothetical protein
VTALTTSTTARGVPAPGTPHATSPHPTAPGAGSRQSLPEMAAASHGLLAPVHHCITKP